MRDDPIFSGVKTWRRRAPEAPPTPQHKWNLANRGKLQAHGMVRIALLKGTLKRGSCEQCGSFRVEAHHDDYDKPLEVRWLCRRHHQMLHALQRRSVGGAT